MIRSQTVALASAEERLLEKSDVLRRMTCPSLSFDSNVRDYARYNIFKMCTLVPSVVELPTTPAGAMRRTKTKLSVMGFLQHETSPEIVAETFSEPQGDRLSRGDTVISIVNVLVGAGMLSLPYGFKLAGWAAFAVLFAVLIVLVFTALLIDAVFGATAQILDLLRVPDESRDFSILGSLAFGKRGQAFIGVAFAFELYAAVLSYFVIIGTNIKALCDIHQSSAIMGSGLLTLALFYVPMKVISYLSMISVFSICATAGALLWSGMALDVDEGRHYHSYLHVDGLISALGLSLVCFAGHPCLPSVYWKMKRPQEEFRGACVLGFMIAAIFYGSVAGIGYYFYGDYLAQSVTDNIATDLQGRVRPSFLFLRIVASGAFVVKIQGALPLLIAPVATVMESSLGMGAHTSWARTFLLRAALMLVSIVLAVRFEHALAAILTICGCVLTMTTSVIFPCVVYYVLTPDSSLVMRTLLLAVSAFGVVLAVRGAVTALAG